MRSVRPAQFAGSLGETMQQPVMVPLSVALPLQPAASHSSSILDALVSAVPAGSNDVIVPFAAQTKPQVRLSPPVW